MEERLKIEIPVSKEFRQFNDEFVIALQSESRLIQSAIDHIMASSGKHIRPLLLLLSAKACGNVTDTAINAAVLLELLHTATLIHDDVVDETKQRRGVPSLNAIFDNRISVLVGDFFLSAALIRSIKTNNMRIISIVSNLGKDLSEGEISQLETVEDMVLDEFRYVQVIRKKTAVLLSACSEIGAIAAGAPEEMIGKFRLFGELLGYCFQIKDDIFDYYKNQRIGKPTGNDIREGKVTLPLLYALKSSSSPEVDGLIDIIKRKDFSEANIERLIAFAKENGGIEYAEQQMKRFCGQAKEVLSFLPESDARESLLLLADYIVTREK